MRTIRSFTEMLGLLSRGRFSEKLDEHLAKSLEALEGLPNEKGTAKITVEVTFNFENGALDIKPSVKSKLPEEKGFSGTTFWSHEGGLSVQHPSQADMFPRTVSERGLDRDLG